MAGERHALRPTSPPREGEERETLCGKTVLIPDPSYVDWLAPTCACCMEQARMLCDAPERKI
ncbi:hypothetical protein HUO13_00885 [Saccharopolyspora erythraea]|nr:hypothetical protein HUO13_00885 [Saccharopolyspora erythraea]